MSPSARLSRPSKKARFGNPVRLSWVALWVSESFSCFRCACQASSSSSRPLKSLLSSCSSAIGADGTRSPKVRSRRTACATLAISSSELTMPCSIRRERTSAHRVLSTRQAIMPSIPRNRKRSRLPPLPLSQTLPTCLLSWVIGKTTGSGSAQWATICSMPCSGPSLGRCQLASTLPLLSRILASDTSSLEAISTIASRM
ncbi:hypothetical protein D3C79_665980 [compost metagenome]